MKHPSSLHTVNFQECDALGHLNNARYLDYFINAREMHLRDHYQIDSGALLAAGMGWVVTGHEIAYLRPANLYERIRISTALIDYSDSSVTVEHIMTDAEGKQLKSVLWTRYTFVDARTGRRMAHTDELMNHIKTISLDDVPVGDGLQSRIGVLRNHLTVNITDVG